MNAVNKKWLLVILLAFSVGTIGCAAVQPFSTTSLNSPNVGETTSVKMASKPASPTAKKEAVTTPVEQFAQVSSPQTVQPTTSSPEAAPLTTLGPSDDLLSMVKQASGVVLIDFYADWCGPCRTQGGILHEMEPTARQNDASIIKINVDQHRQLASAFSVASLPTLVLIKDGKIIDRQIGLANRQQIAALLSK